MAGRAEDERRKSDLTINVVFEDRLRYRGVEHVSKHTPVSEISDVDVSLLADQKHWALVANVIRSTSCS